MSIELTRCLQRRDARRFRVKAGSQLETGPAAPGRLIEQNLNKLVQEKRLGSENSESWDLRDLRTSCEGNTSFMGSPGPKD